MQAAARPSGIHPPTLPAARPASAQGPHAAYPPGYWPQFAHCGGIQYYPIHCLQQPQPRVRYVRVREVPVYVENRYQRSDGYSSSSSDSGSDSDYGSPRRTGGRKKASPRKKDSPHKKDSPRKEKLHGKENASSRESSLIRRPWSPFGYHPCQNGCGSHPVHVVRRHRREPDRRKYDSVSSDSDSDPKPIKKKPAAKKPAAKTPVAKKPGGKKPAGKTPASKPTSDKDKSYRDEPLDYAKDDGYYGPYGHQTYPQVWYHHPPNCCCCNCAKDKPKSRPRAFTRRHRAKAANRTSTVSAASLNLLTKDFSHLGDNALIKLALLAGRGQYEAED